jgi:hypothetical protein
MTCVLTPSFVLSQVLQNPATSYQAWTLVNWYLTSKFNLIYANLLSLLDLPKIQLIPPRLPQFREKTEAKTRRRIKVNSDIFDCEDSDDDSQKGAETKMDVGATAEAKDDNSQENSQEKSKIIQHPVATEEDAIALSGIKILSELYDNLSYSDAHLKKSETAEEGLCGHNQPFNWSSGQLCPGLVDSRRLESQVLDSLPCDLQAGINVYSVHKANQRLQKLKQKMETVDITARKKATKSLSLPVPSGNLNSTELRLCPETTAHNR